MEPLQLQTLIIPMNLQKLFTVTYLPLQNYYRVKRKKIAERLHLNMNLT